MANLYTYNTLQDYASGVCDEPALPTRPDGVLASLTDHRVIDGAIPPQ